MKELDEYRQRARTAREDQFRIEENLQRRRNLLRHKRDQLARVLRLGKAGSNQERILRDEINALEKEIENDTRSAQALKGATAQLLEEPVLEPQPWELIEGLSDSLPFLLLPIRIETRFMTVERRQELWVRIFPDDIAVHTHEGNLTAEDVQAGKIYWQESWRAQQEPSGEKRQSIEKGAWRVLAQAFGGSRAAWIRDRTRPINLLDATTVDELKFPEFPQDSLSTESWSKAPRTKIMPDRFVVMGFLGENEVFRQVGNSIPNPLIIGPDPQAAEAQFRQQDGELLVGDDIAWIYDFKKAVEIGMGMQIELPTLVAARGLSKLLVLGLRLSTDEKESQALVEELLENHSYSLDGLSFVPQGTPTNNTDRQGSGFSSVDPAAETSFALETNDVPFEPVDDRLQKRDGQRLVESLGLDYVPPEAPNGESQGMRLGIGHTPLQRIENADRGDVRDALLMNRALWSGTLGYYIEEMLNLDLTNIGKVRSFFVDNVTGRGPLPAIRAGTQPYGMLLTSDFSMWKWSRELDGEDLTVLNELYAQMRTLETTMAGLIQGVARVGAAGDPYDNLLKTLGLQASSVEFYRRRAVGSDYLWNYRAFTQDEPFTLQGLRERIRMMKRWGDRAEALAPEVGIGPASLPNIFRLVFFQRQDLINDPVVDDIAVDELEKLSETKKLRSIYKVTNPQHLEESIVTNYIGWLGWSPYPVIKNETFLNLAEEEQPIPRPLLYRLLRASLLQALHNAALSLYHELGLVSLQALREVELNILEAARTVTRWEFMDADISEVMSKVSNKSQRVAEFLLSEEGLGLPEVKDLRETLMSIRAMADLSTAQLERAFAEHIDLCSYRLDAWQSGCFNRRLQQQRFPSGNGETFEKRVQGLYLGAFGWVEDLRPAPQMAPADPSSIPTSLHDPQRDGALFEQPDNAGFIHGPSLNHAVTAAVLRSAYLTHFDPAHPEKMAVDLSSERVRLALSFLEGVRNGQELGALLGYQFERGLHDRHKAPSLNQYIPFFREQYPLVADKITEDQDGEQIEMKEARNVFDGYALVEAAFLKDPKLEYPYDVKGLPDIETPDIQEKAHIVAIQAEVNRMAESLDAIADLALAEGVYQVAQGNFDRAGAMLKAMTQGESPPDPEIVRTPRSGATITQRVVLHLPSGTAANPSPRAAIEPGLNRWLREQLPSMDRISYAVSLAGGTLEEQNLAGQGLWPIDLVYMIGDDLNGETTELESRIAFQNRVAGHDDHLEVRIDFMAEPSDPKSITLFELLPLLRALRRLVTSSRPLAAVDYQLPSETPVNLAENPDPLGIILEELKCAQELESRVDVELDPEVPESFASAVNALTAAIPPAEADRPPDTGQANAAKLRTALRRLSNFGVPDAVPRSAFGPSDEAKSTLTHQAVNIHAVVSRSLEAAKASKKAADDALAAAAASERMAAENLGNPEALKTAVETTLSSVEESIAHYRSAAQAIFGPAFNLIPTFSLKNQAELQAAKDFRDAGPPNNLTRHHRENPFLVDDWVEGAARVQSGLSNLETINILAESFGKTTQPKPIQLPFRDTDHWVAVEYPEGFLPQGEFLSILQVLPTSGFQPAGRQSGLVIDEWIETIPSKSETTGIAFHFNQPNSEPPQVCLLAVTPEVTGSWTWDKLVGILHDTLKRAKQRAVEPEQLGDAPDKPYGHLLPAIIAPVAARPSATITTDLIHQTSVPSED